MDKRWYEWFEDARKLETKSWDEGEARLGDVTLGGWLNVS